MTGWLDNVTVAQTTTNAAVTTKASMGNTATTSGTCKETGCQKGGQSLTERGKTKHPEREM